ncbi:hypothetical protein OG875_13050 [Streptomyces sp. NBC_01498]|uniref:hypothetical protein n=1 Tax=Streptomyces sp. NBC_01498 TaxID=2975870 RepID=UPI002E7B7B8A|nr:hypothetical protein [Streptomyces sp. NBC_01498]WTL25435.1 hypothetical protein OG875_13050 [Streptomyces sp. NBC_01498]
MRKLVRTGTAVTGLVAALALIGCGGGDGGDPGPAADKGSAGAPAPGGSASGGPEGGTDASTPATGDDAKGLEGSWTGLTDGKAVTLSVKEGRVALIADKHVCQGSVEDMGGEPMLSLTCVDGNTDRAMGSIESNDGKSLVLSWEGGAKDSLRKADPGALPTGLPTDIQAP